MEKSMKKVNFRTGNASAYFHKRLTEIVDNDRWSILRSRSKHNNKNKKITYENKKIGNETIRLYKLV